MTNKEAIKILSKHKSFARMDVCVLPSQFQKDYEDYISALQIAIDTLETQEASNELLQNLQQLKGSEQNE